MKLGQLKRTIWREKKLYQYFTPSLLLKGRYKKKKNSPEKDKGAFLINQELFLTMNQNPEPINEKIHKVSL